MISHFQIYIGCIMEFSNITQPVISIFVMQFAYNFIFSIHTISLLKPEFWRGYQKIYIKPCCLAILTRNICVTNDHGYVPLVVSTPQSVPFSSLITYHRVCNKNNTMGAIQRAGTTYFSGGHEFKSGAQWGSCCSIISCMCNGLQIVFFPFVFFSFCPSWIYEF